MSVAIVVLSSASAHDLRTSNPTHKQSQRLLSQTFHCHSVKKKNAKFKRQMMWYLFKAFKAKGGLCLDFQIVVIERGKMLPDTLISQQFIINLDKKKQLHF